jgi:hypothetical protein
VECGVSEALHRIAVSELCPAALLLCVLVSVGVFLGQLPRRAREARKARAEYEVWQEEFEKERAEVKARIDRGARRMDSNRIL